MPTNDGVDIAPDAASQMFPDETTEEAVSRIVAGNPQKHSTTLEERLRRAEAQARREAPLDVAEQMYIARVKEIGGDPDEIMVGNKPRYTMDEDGNVKDHETGTVYLLRVAGVGEVLGGGPVDAGANIDAAGTGEIPADAE